MRAKTVRSYKDLEVWQTAMALVTEIYKLTKKFPREELYGLTSQIRRSAVSVPSNIAEGHAKRTTKDFIKFANIAYGSVAEVETQLMIAENLGYATHGEVASLLEDFSATGRMLNGLIAGLERREISKSKGESR